jgi:hypothetical protein
VPWNWDGGAFFQPNPAPRARVGSEMADVHLFYGNWNYNGRQGTCASRNCTFADAALVQYDDTIPFQVGYIAKPSYSGYRMKGDTMAVGTWAIMNKLPLAFLVSGTWLSHVGRSTGWSRGKIDQTCVDTNGQSGARLLCQWRTDALALGGDSGAPVFLDSSVNPPEDVDLVHFVGILWGSNLNLQDPHMWFSPIANIEYAFGGYYFYVCAAPNDC